MEDDLTLTDSVQNGFVTAPSTITGTSATTTLGTGGTSITLSKTVSVTPNVTTAGYISSGTAGNSAISLTATGTFSTTFVEGEFTTNSTTGVQSITIPYSGSGYPIMLSIVIKNGVYNNTSDGNSTWYNSKQRYAVGYWDMTKAEMNTAPTYTTSGSNNYGSMMSTLKNSTSDNTNYTRSGSVNANVFSSSNPSNTAANCVKFKGNKELAVYVSTSSYGLFPNATYSYYILYSA